MYRTRDIPELLLVIKVDIVKLGIRATLYVNCPNGFMLPYLSYEMILNSMESPAIPPCKPCPTATQFGKEARPVTIPQSDCGS